MGRIVTFFQVLLPLLRQINISRRQAFIPLYKSFWDNKLSFERYFGKKFSSKQTLLSVSNTKWALLCLLTLSYRTHIWTYLYRFSEFFLPIDLESKIKLAVFFLFVLQLFRFLIARITGFASYFLKIIMPLKKPFYYYFFHFGFSFRR